MGMTVDGLENAGQIREIEIVKQVNRHSVCKVKLLLDDSKQLQKLKELMGKEVTVEDDEYIFMRGFVKAVSGETAYLNTTAVVTIISFSGKADEKPCSRIFQDVEKTYGDLFGVLNGTGMYIQAADRDFARQKEPKTVVQYGETDFAFAVRIAADNSCDVFVNDTDTAGMLNIGTRGSQTEKAVESRDIVSLSWNADGEKEYMEIRLRDYYEFGSRMEVEGRTYVVVSLQLLYHNGENSYCYGLRKETDFGKAENRKRQTFHVGAARVTSNRDPDNLGRIQAEFLDMEDSLPSNRVWISYLPPLTEKGGGQVFIPDEGEIVHVFVEDGTCYADGCVRRTAIEAEDVETRTFSVRNQVLAFSASGIQIKSFGYGLRMEEGGIYIEGEGVKIEVKKEEVLLECKDTKVKLDAQNACIKAASKTELGGEKILAAGKELRLKGDTIKAETSGFDITG